MSEIDRSEWDNSDLVSELQGEVKPIDPSDPVMMRALGEGEQPRSDFVFVWAVQIVPIDQLVFVEETTFQIRVLLFQLLDHSLEPGYQPLELLFMLGDQQTQRVA